MTDRPKPTMCHYCDKNKPDELEVWGAFRGDKDTGWLISWDDISVNNRNTNLPGV